MKQEVKDEWLAALRSGEYAQARSRLHVDGGYCCLGVLCEVAVKAGVIHPPTMRGTLGVYGGSEDILILPQEVIEWAELEEENPSTDIRPDKDPYALRSFSLAELNDGTDYAPAYSFAQIADVIERCL